MGRQVKKDKRLVSCSSTGLLESKELIRIGNYLYRSSDVWRFFSRYRCRPVA